MKYYIGSTNGSGIEADTFEDFVEYLRDMAEYAEAQGDENFDVFVENYLTDDTEDEETEEEIEERNRKLNIFTAFVEKKREQCPHGIPRYNNGAGTGFYCKANDNHVTGYECARCTLFGDKFPDM